MYEANSSCVMSVILMTTLLLQGIDITRRNLMLIILRASRVESRLEIFFFSFFHSPSAFQTRQFVSKAVGRSHSIPGQILDWLKKVDPTLRSHGRTVNSIFSFCLACRAGTDENFEVLLLPEVLPSTYAQSLTLANPKWCLPAYYPMHHAFVLQKW